MSALLWPLAALPPLSSGVAHCPTQMSLFFAPAFFAHLLGKCLRQRRPVPAVARLGTAPALALLHAELRQATALLPNASYDAQQQLGKL